MKIHLAAALLLGSAAFGPALAADLSDADRAFLVKEAHGAAYELQSAKLAASKATRQDVKDYADKLVHDHEKYNAALEKLGKQEGLTLPSDLDDAAKAHMKDLRELSGKAFDDLYVREALRINAEDERDGKEEKAGTKVQAIKDFLAAFDDMDRTHEDLAKKLAKANG